MLHNFCSQELQDGTGTDWARSAWKLLHIKVDLSPFLLMDLHLILHCYSCTATTLYCHFRNIEFESNGGSHLEYLDALGPGRRIFKTRKSVHRTRMPPPNAIQKKGLYVTVTGIP